MHRFDSFKYLKFPLATVWYLLYVRSHTLDPFRIASYYIRSSFLGHTVINRLSKLFPSLKVLNFILIFTNFSASKHNFYSNLDLTTEYGSAFFKNLIHLELDFNNQS